MKQVCMTQLTKTFYKGTPNEKTVLNGLSLDLHKGEFVSVIGGNGAGKSTLLNCLSGSISLDSGSIRLGEKEIGRWKEEKRAAHIGRVFQDPLQGTAPRMTVLENLSLALRRGQPRTLKKGTASHEREEFQMQLSHLGLGLETRLDTPMGLLSGGQRQSIALLMATLKKPELLLLDEHTAALDPKTAQKMMKLTNRIIKRETVTTLLITHNMQHALDYGDRLVMLAQGEVIMDVSGEKKARLTIPDVLDFFQHSSENSFSDGMLLG